MMDNLIAYEATDCIGLSTRGLYQERFPNRCFSYHTTFASVNRKPLESDSGPMKSLVYETSYPSVEHLIAGISVAVGRIRQMPGILQYEGFPCSLSVRPARRLLDLIWNNCCRTTFQ
ncbi:hypothetical protein TNCV_10571 [Trichonephila clavipes]|nr:hypothetical protein TNCV_10571 [Trichonephila clavipes]